MIKTRLNHIDFLVGIAIFLVVLGHFGLPETPDKIPIYNKIRHNIIYMFHMPLFMFLSGFIAFYTYKPLKRLSEYLRFFKGKVKRLLPAYLIMSTLFFVGKLLLGYNFNYSEEIVNILIHPRQSVSGFIWYIYTLFFLYITLPIYIDIIKNKLILFIVISYALTFIVKATNFMALDDYLFHLPFFLLGCFLAKHKEKVDNNLKNLGIIFLILFLIWVVLVLCNISFLPMQIVSLIAIFALYYSVRFLFVKNQWFETLGRNSFYIYLFNTAFTSTIQILIIKLIGYNVFSSYYYYFIFPLVLIGIYFPIWLHQYFISRVPVLSKLIK